jgi:hypothetical protein
MKSIFPTSIDGDLLKLVHLSNGFRMLDGTEPLRVCNAEACIVSVTNTDAGKVVKVVDHIYAQVKQSSRLLWTPFTEAISPITRTPLKLSRSPTTSLTFLTMPLLASYGRRSPSKTRPLTGMRPYQATYLSVISSNGSSRSGQWTPSEMIAKTIL